jgi:serpin B
VARANVLFAGDLFRALRGQGGNLFFSPHSVSVALAMTSEGARGETQQEMRAALRLPAEGPGDGYQRLARALEPRTIRTAEGEVPAYRLASANALWGQHGYAFVPEFGARLAAAYAARFSEVDFRRPDAARAAINAWAEEATAGKIRDLLPQGLPTPDTRLVLTNAVHFKAGWAESFPARATEDGTFARDGGGEVRVRLMRRTDGFTYGETERAQVLEIPYQGGGMSMVVVLPKTKGGLAEVESSEGIEAWTGALQRGAYVAVKLPRFTFSTGFELTEALKGLGMRRAFDGQAADFSGISAAERLFVGAVLHKAFVAVDEKGTEAAAATAVAIPAAEAPGPERTPIPFTADHPFLFLVRHRATGTVLFLGRVADPS